MSEENENLKKVTSINLSVANIKWAKGKHLNLSDMVDSYLTGEREKDVGTD